jgi:hypothetical protein
MASQQIIQGAMVDSPGRYQLCWITHTEAGDVQSTTRNVVVAQHGAWFYLQFADENFQPYPCGHEGLRCDLLDPSSAWLIPVAIELAAHQTIEPGDIAVHTQRADLWMAIPSKWFGKVAENYVIFCGGEWSVIRPVSHNEHRLP